MADYIRIFQLKPFDKSGEKPYRKGTYHVEYTKYNAVPVYTYKENYTDYEEREISVPRKLYPRVTSLWFKTTGTIKEWKLEKKTHYQEKIIEYLNGDTIAGMYLLYVKFDDWDSCDSYELPEYYHALLIKEVTKSYETTILKFAFNNPIAIPNDCDFYNKDEVDALIPKDYLKPGNLLAGRNVTIDIIAEEESGEEESGDDDSGFWDDSGEPEINYKYVINAEIPEDVWTSSNVKAGDNIIIEEESGESGEPRSWRISTENKVIVDGKTIIQDPETKEVKVIGMEYRNGGVQYDWKGTLAEYESGLEDGTIDEDWLCFITDDGAVNTSVDGFLSLTSTNPVKNKIITKALQDKADKNTVYTKEEIDEMLSGSGIQPGPGSVPVIIRRKKVTGKKLILTTDLSSAVLIKVYKNGLLLEEASDEIDESGESGDYLNDYYIDLEDNSINFTTALLKSDKVAVEVY